MNRITTCVVVTCLVLSLAGVALADAGDIAIFTEAGGGDVITTSVFDHSWDTITRDDSATFDLVGGAGGTGIELTEAGHYLVMYSARFDDQNGGTSNSQRVEIQSNLDLSINGPQYTGWSQGYIRGDSGQFETITAGGGIINASANEVLRLQSFRTDDTTAANRTIERDPAASGIQLLKLDDDWDYLRLSRSTNQAGPTSETFIDVTYDSQQEVDAGSFGHTSGSGDITLVQPGHYLVLANTYFRKTANTTRTNFAQQLTLDGSMVAGSFTTVYQRGNQSTNDGAASIGMIIESTSANQTLNVEVARDDGTGNNILADRTAVTIVKLPDDGDYIRLTDLNSQDLNPASTTALDWGIQRELDTGGFTHTGSRIGAVETDDYLFFTAFADQATGETERAYPWQRWRENGSTIYDYGHTGKYHRNSGGSHWAGNWSGLLLGMDAGDYVETVTQQIGQTGGLTAEHMGLQGVRISSLFPVVIAGLDWDEAGDGNWADLDGNGNSNWLSNGSPTSAIPGAADTAVIKTDRVTVAAPGPQSALITQIQSGVLDIEAGAMFNLGQLAQVQGGVFEINGMLLGAAADIEVTSGLVDVNTGAVVVAGGYNIAGGASMDVAAGATVSGDIETAGTTTLNAGALGTVGVLDVTGGTATVDSAIVTTANVTGGTMDTSVNIANVNVDGGSANATAAVEITNLDVLSGAFHATAALNSTIVSVSGGTFDVDGALTAPTINISGGTATANSTVTTDDLSVTGTGSFTAANTGLTLQSLTIGDTAVFDVGGNIAGAVDVAGTAAISGGTATVYGSLSAPTIDISGGAVTANSAVTVDDLSVTGTGSFAAANTGLTLQSLTVGGTALFDVGGSVAGAIDVAGTADISGGTVIAYGSLTAGILDVSGGTTTVLGTVTTPQMDVSGGLVNLGSTLEADALTVSGGTVVSAGAILAEQTILVNGGIIEAGGPLDSNSGDPELRIVDGGAVIAKTANALGWLDKIVVDNATSGGALVLETAQETVVTDFPGLVEVMGGSLLAGDMTGAVYDPADPNHNVFFHDGAGFRATAGPSPTVANLEAMGAGTRLVGAIIGADANETFNIGTTGIYAGLAFGSWTVGGFNGTATGDAGFEIEAGGVAFGFDGGRLDVGDPNNDVIEVSGVGDVLWKLDPNSTAKNFVRQNGSVDTLNTTFIIHFSDPNIPGIRAGDTVKVVNGMIHKTLGSDANFIDAAGTLIVGEQARFHAMNPPQRGTVIVEAGGIATINAATDLATGAVWQWANDPNSALKPKLVIDNRNIDPNNADYWPDNADIILYDVDANSIIGEGLKLSQGARLTGRSGGNVGLHADAGDVGLGVVSGTTMARITAAAGRNTAFNTHVDFRWDRTDPNSERASLWINDPNDYVTIVGGGNNDMAKVAQNGNVYINQNTWVKDMIVWTTSDTTQVRLGNTGGSRIDIAGKLDILDGFVRIVNQGEWLAAGTVAADGIFVHDKARLQVNQNGTTWGQDVNQAITYDGNSLTAVGEWGIECNEGGSASYLNLANLTLKDGVVLGINETGGNTRISPLIQGSEVSLIKASGGEHFDIHVVRVDGNYPDPIINVGTADGLGVAHNVQLYNQGDGNDAYTLRQISNGGRLTLGVGNSETTTVGEDGWGGHITIEAGNKGIVRLNVNEPDSGTNTNIFDGPVFILGTGETDFTAEIEGNRSRDAAGTNWAVFNDVRLADGGIVAMDQVNCNLRLANVTLLGSSGGIHNVDGDNRRVGNIIGNGAGGTVTITGTNRMDLYGKISNNARVVYDNTDIVDLGQEKFADTPAEPATSFDVEGGSELIIHTAPDTIIWEGQDGASWGDPNGLVTIDSPTQLYVTIRASDGALPTDPPPINSVDLGLKVAADSIAFFRSDRNGTDTSVNGEVWLQNMILDSNSLAYIQDNDVIDMNVSGTVLNSGTLRNTDDDDLHIQNWTGPGHLTIDGSRTFLVEGTLNPAELTIDTTATLGTIFNGTAKIGTDQHIQATTVNFNSLSTFNDANTVVDVAVANFNTPVTFAPGMSVTIGSAHFNASGMDLGLASWDITDAYVGTDLTIDSPVGGPPTWHPQTGGNLQVEGAAAVAGSDFVLEGGAATFLADGDTNWGVPVRVMSASAMHIDRLTEAGGEDKTFTFGPLTFTDSGQLSLSSDNGHNYEFGGTNVNVTGAIVRVITEDTDVDLGPVSFDENHWFYMLASAGSTVTMGPANSNGFFQTVFFGDTLGEGIGGGALKLTDSPNWTGFLVIANDDYVVMEKDVVGFNAGTIDVSTGGIDVRATGALDLSGWAPKHLRLTSDGNAVVAPAAEIAGALVVANDVAASFAGSGGTPVTVAGGVIRAEKDGADFAANVDVTSAVQLGQGDPNGPTGADFEISGVVGGAGSLDKVGSETITLSGTNTYAGGTTVNNGKLVMADTSALGTGSSVAVTSSTAALSIAVSGADFSAGGYTLTAPNGRVYVDANNVDLSAADVHDLVLNVDMTGSTAPDDRANVLRVNVPEIVDDYRVDLSGSIVANNGTIIRNAVDSDAFNYAKFEGRQTIGIDSDIVLGGDRQYDVLADTTAEFLKSISGTKITKRFEGTLKLSGDANGLALLEIGEVDSPGGFVVVSATGTPPASVVINPGGAYSVQQADYAYGEVSSGSEGVVALSRDSNATMDWTGTSTRTLGALENSTYSGALTPGDDGAGTRRYMFGGGGATLRIESVLGDIDSNATDVQFGWYKSIMSPDNDPIPEGIAVVAANNTVTGDVDIYMPVIYDSSEPFGLVDGNTSMVYVHGPDGQLDLNNTGARQDNILSLYGSIANSGGTLTAAGMAAMFPSGDYIVGSTSSGTTDVEDGAFLRADANLRKVGTDTVVLLDPNAAGASLNTFGSVIPRGTYVEGGTLVIGDTSSLGQGQFLTVEEAGTAHFPVDASYNKTINLAGTINVPGGVTLSLDDPNAVLALQAGAPAVTGGGLMDLGANGITGQGMEIQGNSTVRATIGSADPNAGQQSLIVRSGSTAQILWDGLVAVNVGQMHPSSTLRIESAVGANNRATHNNGKLVDLVVDEAAWLADSNTGSSPANPYKIVVDGGGDGYFGVMPAWGAHPQDGNLTYNTGLLSTPTVQDQDGKYHHPVAYIEKTGPGMLGIGGSLFGQPDDFNDPDQVARVAGKAYWLVKEGDLGVIQLWATLGATAGTWVEGSGWAIGTKDPTIAQKNLEGVELFEGTSLTWAGNHGFLPASVWKVGEYANEQGDGFNPGEFIMENGSALYAGWITGTDGHRAVAGVNSYDWLGMGLEEVDPLDPNIVTTYLLYPTIRSTDSNTPTVTFGGPGRVELRSGVDADTLNDNGSTYHAVVSGGRVEFSGDLEGAMPVNNFETLVADGVAAVYQSHDIVTNTAIGFTGGLEFNDDDDGNDLVYTGPIHNDGLVQTVSGTTDLGSVVISSSPSREGIELLTGPIVGEYFSNITETVVKNIDFDALGDPNFTRNETTINYNNNFNLTGGDPNWATGTNNFAVRWTADLDVDANEAGLFEFWLNSDDGSMLYIDGNVVIDNDGDHSPATQRASIVLDEGIHSLVLGFHQTGGGRVAQLGWDFGLGDVLFDGNAAIITSGDITVDPNTFLKLGGFTNAGVVTVDGAMDVRTGPATAERLNIGEGGNMGLGSASLDVGIGTINGTLTGDGTGTTQFETLTIGGLAPVVDLGATGLLQAATANINAASFTFGANNKASFGTMNVGGQATIGAGASVQAASAVVTSNGRLIHDGGDADVGSFLVNRNGTLQLNTATGLPASPSITNDGTVHVPAGAVVDLSTTNIGASPLTPVPIFDMDIGTAGDPSVAGSWSETDGVHTIIGSGSDIWNNNDHFHYVYTDLSGDADVEADVTSINAPDNGWAKFGIMIRESLTDTSKHAHMLISRDQGASFQRRLTTGGGSTSNTPHQNQPDEESVPVRLRLVREGDLFTGYVQDTIGGAWFQVAQDTVAMPEDVYIGLAVTSHSNGNLATGIFENATMFEPIGGGGTIQVDAGGTFKLGSVTGKGINAAGLLELHAGSTAVTDTVIPAGGAVNLLGTSSLDSDTGSVAGSLLGNGTGLARFDELSIEGTSPSIDLSGGPLEATVATVKSNGYGFDGGSAATFGTLQMEGDITTAIEPTANVTATQVNVDKGQTLALRGGTMSFGAVENKNLVHVQSGVNDLSGTVISSPTGSDLPQTANLQAYWPMDGNAADTSGNGRDGTIVGGAGFAPGQLGQAIQMDGTDDQVDIVGYKGVTGTQARTMSAWVKITKAEAAILSWGTDAGGEKWIWRSQTGNGTPNTQRVEVNGGYIVGDTVVNDDQWYHLVAVMPAPGDNINLVKFYVNGQPEPISATLARAINTASSLDVRIGQDHSNRRFQGLLDEVGIWDVALTDQEVNDLYNWTGLPVPGDIRVDAGARAIVKGITDAGTLFVNGVLELEDVDSSANSVAIGAAGQLDIGQASLTILEDSLASVVVDIADGYNGGAWDGNGIVSSVIAANPGTGVYAYDTGDGILVDVTIPADVDLSKTVGFEDYVLMRDAFGTASLIDTNYDGVLDHLDYLNLKTNYGLVSPVGVPTPGLAGGAAEAVPEPATLALLAFGAAGVVLRRRRKH